MPDNATFPVYQIPLILASNSPRRIDLMRGAGFTFEVADAGVATETYPSDLQAAEIPLYLSRLKADTFLNRHSLQGNTVLITADTIVWLQNKVLGKPKDRQDAIRMLNDLSGNVHQVFTAVCLTSTAQQRTFYSESKVWFRHLTADEMVYYTDHFRPYDKAGAYGIQEWIGLVGIEKIEGSCFNVVGLPVHQLYSELLHYVQ
ncbi:MAG: Maf family nucleotide pyrophosphatase [Bacteroidales bacterium]|jgi:septum formation protein|nr:Maf family nucleotide pyrophosphatase [Bacteroidales bacterium]